MKEKKTIKKKITIKFLRTNNNYNYMIKKTIEKITIKFLHTNNNYNYMINDEREKKTIKKKLIFTP